MQTHPPPRITESTLPQRPLAREDMTSGVPKTPRLQQGLLTSADPTAALSNKQRDSCTRHHRLLVILESHLLGEIHGHKDTTHTFTICSSRSFSTSSPRLYLVGRSIHPWCRTKKAPTDRSMPTSRMRCHRQGPWARATLPNQERLISRRSPI